MPRTRVLVLAAVAVLVVSGLVWRPWDDLPRLVRGIVAQVEAVPGVVEVDADGDLAPGWRSAPESSFVRLVVRLDPALSPDEAQRAADDAASAARLPEADEGAPLVLDVTVAVGGTSADDAPARLRVTADAPPEGAPGHGRVATAVRLLRAGATSVDETTVVVPDVRTLVDAAALLDGRDLDGHGQALRTADGAVTYEYGLVPRAATARLLAETAALRGVTGVHMVRNQSTPSTLDVTRDGDDVGGLRARLEAADETSVVTPTLFTLAGGGAPVTGWVAGLEPPRTVPRTVPLPDGVEAWPADPRARDCTGDDLRVTGGPPDAATGARYLGLRAENVSGAPCALEGVPQLVFRNADGEPQQDVRVVAASPGVVPGRVVVPPGATALATLQWRAMSTANDADVTTALDVTPVPGADPVRVIPRYVDDIGSQAGPAELDVLDGAEVRAGPWAQAVDGWS